MSYALGDHHFLFIPLCQQLSAFWAPGWDWRKTELEMKLAQSKHVSCNLYQNSIEIILSYLNCRFGSSDGFLGLPIGVSTLEILSILDNCVGMISLSLSHPIIFHGSTPLKEV